MKVKCPVCGRDAEYEGNPWRPFCSERCKLIDLGKWIEEQYRVPSEEPSPEPEPGPGGKEKKTLQ